MAQLLNVAAVAHPSMRTAAPELTYVLVVSVTDATGAPYRGLSDQDFTIQVMGHDYVTVNSSLGGVRELGAADSSKWGLYQLVLRIPGTAAPDAWEVSSYTLLIQVRRFPVSGRFLAFGRARPDHGQTLVGLDFL